MRKKRFSDWEPESGELAVVPGGPACSQYLDKLTEIDVEAINSGHRGYKPRVVNFVIKELMEQGGHKTTTCVIDKAIWMDNYERWESLAGFKCKKLSYIVRSLRRSNNGTILMLSKDPNDLKYFDADELTL